MNLPIQITEQKIDENWRPEKGQQYIVEYRWKNGNINWIIGKFHEVWFGYTFHWFWSASNLQLSIGGKGSLKVSDDYKKFKRVYLFEPYPKHIEKDFIDEGEMEI